MPPRDRWADWLAERRFGGDPETRRRVMTELTARRDRVLDLVDGRATGQHPDLPAAGSGQLTARTSR
jgi:hypothetical protein